eukprot:44632-Prymnesium_polylepis.1
MADQKCLISNRLGRPVGLLLSSLLSGWLLTRDAAFVDRARPLGPWRSIRPQRARTVGSVITPFPSVLKHT